jgi:hypothetical protein
MGGEKGLSQLVVSAGNRRLQASQSFEMSFFWISVELVSSIGPFDPGAAFVAGNPTSLSQLLRQRIAGWVLSYALHRCPALLR